MQRILSSLMVIGAVFSVQAGAESMVAGQVRLASGEPVAGAHVRLFDLRDLRSWVGTTTDETGSFALPLAALPGATVQPQQFHLGANYPNPFNPSTIIPYRLHQPMSVRLEVFNVLGQHVATLVDGEQASGLHTAQWDATNAAGQAVAAGMYLYRLSGEGVQATRSMVLIDGQAGVPARASGALPQAGAEATEAASVYGLTVSGPGLMPFVDPAFRVGSGSVAVELVEASAGMARAKTALDEHDAGYCFSGEVLGDVDNNSRVDFFDALLVALYSEDPSTVIPNNGDISLGDVNADGRIDFTDAYLIAGWLNDPSDPTVPAGIGEGDGGVASPDCAALVALYEATDGDNWENNANWLSDQPLDEWFGVTTDDDGRVTSLELYENGLLGVLPAELGSLTNLQTLHLYENELSGALPAELGSLTNLQTLHLYDNQLSGELPAELGNLTNLRELHLYENELSGELPTELGNLTNLRELVLDENDFSGGLPESLSNLTHLELLYLDRTQLSGPLPESLGNLTNLELLDLRNTQLCAPTDAAFQTWLLGIAIKRGVVNCEDGGAGPFHSTFEQPTRSEMVVVDGIEIEAAENEILVFLDEDVSSEEIDDARAEIQAQGGSVKSLNFDLRTIQVGITDAIVEQDFIDTLSRQSGVSGANVNEVVVPDQSFITSNDAGYRQRRAKPVATQLVPPPSPVSFAGDFWINQIDAVSAWNALSDPGVMLVPNAIGIVDTGVPSPYDVLNSSRINRYTEEGIALSGDDSSHPHGYNVTGYAAGYSNGPDRRGVNPHSDVVFVDVLRRDPCCTYVTSLLQGIKTAIDNGAGVVNVSWGPGGLRRDQVPSVRQDVMQRWRQSYNGVAHYARKSDVLLVWASGNSFEKHDDRLLPLRNGAIDVANTDSWLSHSLIVGASTESQMDACFSLMGAAVNIMAPGQDVGFGTRTGNGTSYAAPMVTGAAGLVRAIESTISAEETRSILINSAKNTITFNTTCGEPVASSPAGLLNLGSAIQSSLVANGVGLNTTSGVHLARGQMTSVPINVTVPAGGVHAIDVGFVIDQSGSYADDITTLQTRATDIVNNFKARTDVDVQFGVAGFADFPQSPYGDPGDVPYRLYQSITDDQNALIEAINRLNSPLMHGEDGPESQYEALFRTVHEIGWRDGALRILLFATDADFHDSDTESGYPGTGRTATLATLEAENVIVIGLQSGDSSAAAQRLQELADATGGSVLSLDAASSQIVDAIVRGVDAALAKVDITLDVLAGQSWVTGITPPVHQDVRPGATVSFTISLQGQRDPSIEDLPYNVYLWARGDGSALLSRTKIPIIVPGSP